ncbi:MAG TPA: citrate lyase holo-[acyl-carrier protein] synthase [Clostridium sp.]
MDNESVILKEILEARENRARMQIKLINMFKTTLVSFTLNIPGQEKRSSIYIKLHEIGIYLLEEELRKQKIEVVHKIVKITTAGAEAFLNIDADPMHLKKITVSIEEKNELGRLFDFDVFTINGEQISRRQIGLPERKCLLCNENAKVCGRSRKHSIDDLLNKVHQVINA